VHRQRPLRLQTQDAFAKGESRPRHPTDEVTPPHQNG
jgi:hypothetical protein